MPEGDTIWRAATELQRRVGGRTVSSARPDALQRLVGRTLLRVEPVGKHLYMHFNGGIALHSHMRMTGAWHVYTTTQRARRAAHLTTAVLGFGDVRAVLFAAPVCELVSSRAAGGGLGPDILAPWWDVADVQRRAHASSRATIAEVLLDQSVCAGIGNIFRCDALWYERVNPFTSPAALDDEVIAGLYRRARDLMKRAAVADSFRSARMVHGRAGLPCVSCGTTVSAVALGAPSRTVFWCSRCQPAVAAPAERAARSGGGQHPPRDRDPLEERGRDHQRVEDLVEPEGSRPRVGALQRVDDRAGHVGRAAERE